MTTSYKTGKPFPRGAKPSPRHKLLSAIPHLALVAPPPQFAVVPKKLDMWGNDTYGDCVSAEEAFAKAWWSTYCGLNETFATAQEVEAFASQYGYLNGANLTDVMDTMKSAGMSIGGQSYKDGGYAGVDFSNETILQSASSQGPVKVAIDANALPSGAGNQQGWFAVSGSPGQFPNTDHCIAYSGYGSAGYLYDQLKVSLPIGLTSSTPGYLAYTWSTIGFVSHDWIMSTTTEAWLRNPTTPGQAPTPPTPPTPPVPPGPGPTPTPALAIAALGESLAFGKWSNGMAVGSTCQVTGTAKITGLQGIEAPQELRGTSVPLPILLLLYFFKDQLLPLVLADIQAGKSWAQIGLDILQKLLGPQANVVPRRFH